MPLIQRSLSDSQLYNKKVSRIVSRIKKQAHLPESFDDLTHPQTFTNIGDWIKHWDQYHERVKYWLVKFSICPSDEILVKALSIIIASLSIIPPSQRTSAL